MKKPLVPRPCREDWSRLTPEERGHFCTVCHTKVWDLSSLTAEQAEAFLRSHQGEDLCVSYREGPRGEVLHRKPPVVPAARLTRRLPAAATVALALAACDPKPQAAPDPAADTRPAADEQPVADEPPEVDSPDATPEATPEAETGGEGSPEGPLDADEPHVKGKWVPAEPDEEQKPPSEERHVKGKWAPADETDAHDPPIKMGKVAR